MDDWRDDMKRFGHNFELYMIRADGTKLERLTFNTVFDGFPMFSPDGKKLAFASNRNPQKPRATDIFLADWVE
jgi:Tol biopolymer transport system component